MYTLTTFQPDTLDGFKSTFELEVNDISSYPDDLKSLTGMGGFEKDNVLLSPQAELTSSIEVQINGCSAYEIVYLQGFPGSADKSKILETFFVDCNKEYVLRYSGTVDLKYSGENAFEKIIYWTEKGNKLRNLSRLSL